VLVASVQPADLNPHPRNEQGVSLNIVLLKDGQGKPLAGGEYLDVLYLTPLPGRGVHATAIDQLVRRAQLVPEWKEGARIGWEIAPTREHIQALRLEVKNLKAKADKAK
jgi:hypothetical protein